jgi:hypothetical protein
MVPPQTLPVRLTSKLLKINKLPVRKVTSQDRRVKVTLVVCGYC